MERDPKGGLDDTLAAEPARPASGDATSATVAAPPSGAPTLAASWPSATGIDPGATGSSLMRYTLGTVLGRGGMGEVVSARDEQIGRSVAIKRMRATDPTPEQTARFLREAKIQGRLDHPAIVPVHELWRDEHGQPYFVMKQLTGVTLGDVLDKLSAGDAATAKKHTRQALLRAFADICLAIEFAHTKGIVHRDLKPANIVLGDFGEVYVLDWGIARVVGEEGERASFSDVTTLDTAGTVAGALLGTPGYMSPEQVRGELDLDARSDIYALGCILFELLALVPLHPRGQRALASTLDGPDTTPSTRSPEREIAPELDVICLAATQLAPADRYASARELGEAVQRFLDGDRDLALRRELARTELAAARAALAAGSGAAERRTAIRAAARALALDPTAPEPAELVGKLMLEPPTDVPPEVEAEVAELEQSAVSAQARSAVPGVLAYFLFFPMCLWVGFRADWHFIVGPALVAIQLAITAHLVRRPKVPVSWWAFGLNLLFVALVSHMASPFVIGAGLAIIGAMGFAMYPAMSPGWLIAAPVVGAVLWPVGAQLLGDGAHVVDVVGGDFVIHVAADHLDATPALLGLSLFVILVVSLSTMLARTVALKQRSIQRTLHLQAWQLRQLVPRAEP